MPILADLFLTFAKIGCFTFGDAYGAIPLIREVVSSYGWIDDETLAYMIAVSESTPGPIMVNLATYIGSDRAGLAGALTATAASCLPAALICAKKLMKKKYSPVILILFAAAAGIVFY